MCSSAFADPTPIYTQNFDGVIQGGGTPGITVQPPRVITSINATGVGFNDTTAAAPVGGNTGTTLGQQRLNAFTYAFNLWGATLTSNVTINIQAQFSALSCTATSVTLGSAGATHIFRNFAGAPRTGYSSTTTRARRSIWWK